MELTGNSIYEYIHPLDHEEIGHLLTVQPLHYSQGNTPSLFSLLPNYFFVSIPCPKSLRRYSSFYLVQTVQILSLSVSLFFEWNVFWQKGTRDSQMEDIRWATAPPVSLILDDLVEVFLTTYMPKVWSAVLSTSKNTKYKKIQICWQGNPLFRLPQSEKLSYRQPTIPKRTNKVSLKIW